MLDQQADLREREINAHLDLLQSAKARERRAAAYWLGEAAASDAVPLLVEVYQHDRNNSVRRAAAYALGQFRAVEVALKQGKEEKVVRLLEGVEGRGELGRRLNRAPYRRLLVALLLLFVVLAAAVVIVYGLPTSLSSLAGGLSDAQVAERRAVAADIRPVFDGLRADVETQQAQLQGLLGGGTLDCQAFYNAPGRYTLAADRASAYPDIANLVNQMNNVQANFAAVSSRFERACFENAPLTPAEIGPTYGLLLPSINALPAIELALTALEEGRSMSPVATEVPTVDVAVTAEIGETAVPATATATPPPTETPQPTLTPTRTNTPIPTTEINLANPRRNLGPLYNIVDRVTGAQGLGIRLLGYWTDAQNTGATGGCNLSAPELPSAYQLPQEDAEASPELAEAVTLINGGLEALQTQWNDFVLACNDGSVRSRAASELEQTRAALTPFGEANELLDNVAGQ